MRLIRWRALSGRPCHQRLAPFEGGALGFGQRHSRDVGGVLARKGQRVALQHIGPHRYWFTGSQPKP